VSGNTTLTRLRWSYTADVYGDPQRLGTPASTVLVGCSVSPRMSSDLTEPGRNGIMVGLTVYTPASADIDAATDQIVYRGDTYDIDGDVGRWESPYGSRIGGLEFSLRRAIG